MRIDEQQKYHGAALMQIASDPHFTAINAFEIGEEAARSAFLINSGIGIYLKYATTPVSQYEEYRFTFSSDQLKLLRRLSLKVPHVFLALVCVKGREVCCLPYEVLLELRARRREAKGADEDQYMIAVTLHHRKRFHVYINSPGSKGKMLGDAVTISRADFPGRIFGDGTGA
jgi:hypothetical protein